jgi:hypothetical protein
LVRDTHGAHVSGIDAAVAAGRKDQREKQAKSESRGVARNAWCVHRVSSGQSHGGVRLAARLVVPLLASQDTQTEKLYKKHDDIV